MAALPPRGVAEPPGVRAAVAAGAVFLDDRDWVLMLRPTYKDHWDVPGGYVEDGESPRQACAREIAEEMGLHREIGRLLVVDWAPHPEEGAKVLFLFDGGHLDQHEHEHIVLQESEVQELRYVSTDDMDAVSIPRLTRRLRAALEAHRGRRTLYLEDGAASSGVPAASAAPPGGRLPDHSR